MVFLTHEQPAAIHAMAPPEEATMLCRSSAALRSGDLGAKARPPHRK